MSKMNSTSLYVTTNQIILKSQPENPATWADLYRLLPYLRNSLCCVVCGSLLISPITPQPGKCQHHLCKLCTGGKKKIKPACTWCKDCDAYADNRQLRTLLQCYKQMCVYLSNSPIFTALHEAAARVPCAAGVERGAGNLLALIKEGAMFQDAYESSGGLSKEIYSILPCVYTNSATQTLQNVPVVAASNSSSTDAIIPAAAATSTTQQKNNTNGTPVYSVMFAGSGNKITIKRKPKELDKERPAASLSSSSTTTTGGSSGRKETAEKAIFKRPPSKCTTKPRRGCRCGNATATPGKLTCCGQRCPCYVDSKACIDCKCRGCRNPHTLDGSKVLNHLNHVIQYQEVIVPPSVATASTSSTTPSSTTTQSQDVLLQQVNIELDANLTFEQLNEHLSLKVFEPYGEVPPTLPHTFLMSNQQQLQLQHQADDDEEITVDV